MAGKVTDRDALASVFALHRHVGTAATRIDPNGRHWHALKHAERKGWVWWRDPQRCCVTIDGVRALAPYGVKQAADA
jgi:hypothetical protein